MKNSNEKETTLKVDDNTLLTQVVCLTTQMNLLSYSDENLLADLCLASSTVNKVNADLNKENVQPVKRRKHLFSFDLLGYEGKENGND